MSLTVSVIVYGMFCHIAYQLFRKQ